MSRRLWIVLSVLALAAGGLAYLVETNPVVANLHRAILYERTLDRYAQTDETRTEVTATRDASGRPAALIGALFGRDDDLPHLFQLVACRGAGGKDGMPIVFSHEIDHTTLEPGDIRITKASGALAEITCLTMAPADDPGELRTALLIGQFGGPDDQPARIEIVGNVLSRDHRLNFKGASVAPAALERGPSLVWAEIVPERHWDLGRAATPLPWGGGDRCPVGTKQVVRVAWNGGVSPIRGGRDGRIDPKHYKVAVAAADGRRTDVAPFALADLGDGDNNHLLCLDVAEPATAVWFPAGQVVDPRGDPNEETAIQVTPTDD